MSSAGKHRPLESKVIPGQWESPAEQIARLASEVERLREALKNEIRWNIEGTGIHPDDQEEVIERHYQEALHPDEKEEEADDPGSQAYDAARWEQRVADEKEENN